MPLSGGVFALRQFRFFMIDGSASVQLKGSNWAGLGFEVRPNNAHCGIDP